MRLSATEGLGQLENASILHRSQKLRHARPLGTCVVKTGLRFFDSLARLVRLEAVNLRVDVAPLRQRHIQDTMIQPA